MKIIATTRTKNEEENIERFCRSYIDTGLADLVLIADGGSDDDTVAIAESVPNYMLKENGRRVLEQSDHNFAFAVRVYFWGASQWFPGLSKDRDDQWTTSLWAWRSGLGFRASEVDPWRHGFIRAGIFPPEKKHRLDIMPPLALLHRPWPTEEKADAKREFYRAIGQHPKMKHPTEFGGQLEAIPEWMKD